MDSIKLNSFSIAFVIIFLIFSCGTKDVHKGVEIYDKKLVEFWELYLTAFKSQNIEFLLENSNPEIQCGNCGIEQDSTEWFQAKYLFDYHIDKIMPPLNKKYTVLEVDFSNTDFKNGKIYRVNYFMKKGEGYNLIYSILEKDNKFKFIGMFTVP